MSNKPVIIGWKERVALPAWGIRRIIAKVDTGACVSAIHVDSIEELPDGRVRFEVALKRDGSLTRAVESEVVRVARIKPSHGRAQERYVVRTAVEVGARSMEIELSLVCRKKMRCRMLLGREAVAGAFVVDPSRAFVLGTPGGGAAAAVSPRESKT
jgi:hypothetical protein